MNPAQNPLVNFVPIIAIFAIFYFLIIRPQQKQQKDHEKMLEALKKGDRVLLSGGIYGVITGFKGGELEIKIADNVKVMAARSSVGSLVGEATAQADKNAVTVA